MTLGSALSIAAGGLTAVNQQLALISQNVANAGTAGYVQEVATQQTVSTDGVGMGVREGPTARSINLQLQSSLFSQNGLTSAANTTSNALSAIDIALGSPGANNDLASQLSALNSDFSTLLSTPSSTAEQQQVVGAASSLASSINNLSSTYTTQRQTAQNSLVSDVATLNSNLASIGQLTSQIETATTAGVSTADLQNQRDQAMQSVSNLIGVNFLQQPGGGLLVITGSGLSIPLNANGGAAGGATSGPFAISPATLGPNAAYPGSAPALTLSGVDVTSQITGGTIGANLALRDTTLPTFQAELDEFSQNLASRFNAQGLCLFSDSSGNVPAPSAPPAAVQASYVGFSASIQVNPAIRANPALVRDGTQAIAGSATGATAFTPNPAGGPSGFSTLIQRVLSYSLGTQVQLGVAQPTAASTGLGPLGTLSAPFSATSTLSDIANALEDDQANSVASASAAQQSTQTLQGTLQNSLSTTTAVSIDSEMSTMVQLQQSYSANARVIAAVQQMWNDLVTAIDTTVT